MLCHIMCFVGNLFFVMLCYDMQCCCLERANELLYGIFSLPSLLFVFVISLLIRCLSARRSLLSGNCPIMSGAPMVLNYRDLFHPM